MKPRSFVILVACGLTLTLPLSAAGAWTVAVQADVVAILAAVECYAWWRSRPVRRA